MRFKINGSRSAACITVNNKKIKYGYKNIRWNRLKAEILCEVAGKLLASDRPQEIVEELCTKVMDFLDCHAFFNYLINEKKNMLHLNACAGIPADTANEIKWLDFGAAVCGCVAQEACRIVAENIQTGKDTRTELVKSFGIRAYACHPLMEQNKVIGTLSFGTRSRDTFNNDELALMKAVADHVAIAMIRIRAEKELLEQQQLTINAEIEKSRALLKAIEMKDEFISLISHEFKTPLTVINSAIQAMEHICEGELSEKAKGFLSKIRLNSNRQLKLVNNLLDITRINSGQFKIDIKNNDIVLLTKLITDSIAVFARKKGIRLTYSAALEKRIIGIDGEVYERILLNLLSNAVKFTPAERAIDVLVARKKIKGKSRMCIQVRDSGVGIPRDKTSLIFERFGQVDNSLARQTEGTGIGLYLAKLLIEMMGGEITLESTVGEGSTFTMLFPDTRAKGARFEQMLDEITGIRLNQAAAIEFSDVYL